MQPTARRAVIHTTNLAQTSRSSKSWADANQRVIYAYRAWQRAAPEIVSLYLLDLDVATIRAKIRQEFERHRHVKDLQTVDVLLVKNNAEYQETMNYWKQLPHVLKYFRAEEDVQAHIPKTFMGNFLEGRSG